MQRIIGTLNQSPDKLTLQADTMAELEQAIGHHSIRGYDLIAVRRWPDGSHIAEMQRFSTPKTPLQRS